MALGEGLAQLLAAEEPNLTTLWTLVQVGYLTNPGHTISVFLCGALIIVSCYLN